MGKPILKTFKYRFSIYDPDDIEQEAFLMCIDALPRYKSGSLENFLSVHVRNRIVNLFNKHADPNSEKYKVTHGISLDKVDIDSEKSMSYISDIHTKLEREEILQKINERLPIEYRMDYIKLLSGIKITPSRKNRILKYVSDLFEELND